MTIDGDGIAPSGSPRFEEIRNNLPEGERRRQEEADGSADTRPADPVSVSWKQAMDWGTKAGLDLGTGSEEDDLEMVDAERKRRKPPMFLVSDRTD
jgi:hypothetical protein